jgi:hypothetical protein
VSYLDTLEIAAFLAAHPELRPAPLPDIASAAHAAWLSLRHDYHDDRHLLGVFDPGRGNYAYISRAREWQQTVGFLGKLAAAQATLFRALGAEGVRDLPAAPTRDVARFEIFRQTAAGTLGVWVVRQGTLRFALPLTTGPKTGIADYLPAPHGLRGFAAPVEQVYPALVPFVELADGRTFVAAGPASHCAVERNGRSLRAVWTRWSSLSDPPGTTEDIGITSEVAWTVHGTTLRRRETLTVARAVTLRRWWMALPSTASDHRATLRGGHRRDELDSPEGRLIVSVQAPPSWKTPQLVRIPASDPLGCGARGAVPLHLLYEAKNLEVSARHPLRAELELTVSPSP